MEEWQKVDADLSEYFELQLSEVDMLASMYSNTGEFIITVPSIINDIKKYIAGDRKSIPSELDFTLNLIIAERNAILEVNVALPHEYPAVKPFVSIRSSELNRHQKKELNGAVTEYIKTIDENELCIISVANWLTENAQNYFSMQPSEGAREKPSNGKDRTKDPFCRLWIYSHHIYSKFKRKDIIDNAHDLELTGFSLPGKPGFICVEGRKKDCYEFYQQLKHMCWKKLSLVKEEIDEASKCNQKIFKRFQDFQEISFSVRRGPAREYHMDMGLFLKYLEEHKCGYAFHDLFGLGQASNDK
ncbi:RWD domain-containing protein 2B [Trichonephila clavata]|uniref:RWD domain-containing protein 2B n=1 Tax=Trichonephila clavata TaxID=2740835 RepID=A0A8X6F9V9_TRICU|nr:RWD domain-containing protein 2B [Trichonephila clavata]